MIFDIGDASSTNSPSLEQEEFLKNIDSPSSKSTSNSTVRSNNDSIENKANESKYQCLGPIFGTPLPSLDPSVLPQKIDVIKFWMFLHDRAKSSHNKILLNSGKDFFTSGVLDLVKEEVLKSLVSIWGSKGLKVLNRRIIKSMYDRLIDVADSLGKDPRCRQGYI